MDDGPAGFHGLLCTIAKAGDVGVDRLVQLGDERGADEGPGIAREVSDAASREGGKAEDTPHQTRRGNITKDLQHRLCERRCGSAISHEGCGELSVQKREKGAATAQRSRTFQLLQPLL